MHEASADLTVRRESLAADCRNCAGLCCGGFKGCTVFDCFGADQKMTRLTFSGLTWREVPQPRQLMFEVFPIICQLQKRLWYVNEAWEWSRHCQSDAAAGQFGEGERLHPIAGVAGAHGSLEPVKQPALTGA